MEKTTDAEAAKKQKLKAIVDTLPTSRLSHSFQPNFVDRDELFSYPIDWNAYDKHSVSRLPLSP